MNVNENSAEMTTHKDTLQVYPYVGMHRCDSAIWHLDSVPLPRTVLGPGAAERGTQEPGFPVPPSSVLKSFFLTSDR